MTNPWNSLAAHFDTSKNEDEIPAGAADNILISWQVILKCLGKYAPKHKNLKIIEYGCGGGGFTHKLTTMGHNVVGVDYSPEMIKTAKKAYGKNSQFICADSQFLYDTKPVEVITSVMAVQFIQNIDRTMQGFSQALVPGGLLVFAVFNPAYVVDGLTAKLFFEDFDSNTKPKTGFVHFGNGAKIPVFIRTAAEYTRIAKKHGLKPVFRAYPKFTQTFLKKYPTKMPTKHSEYLILGYQKTN